MPLLLEQIVILEKMMISMSLDNVLNKVHFKLQMTDTCSGADLGEGAGGVLRGGGGGRGGGAPPPPPPPHEMTCSFLYSYSAKKKHVVYWS